jgi:hypothetical protein
LTKAVGAATIHCRLGVGNFRLHGSSIRRRLTHSMPNCPLPCFVCLVGGGDSDEATRPLIFKKEERKRVSKNGWTETKWSVVRFATDRRCTPTSAYRSSFLDRLLHTYPLPADFPRWTAPTGQKWVDKTVFPGDKVRPGRTTAMSVASPGKGFATVCRSVSGVSPWGDGRRASGEQAGNRMGSKWGQRARWAQRRNPAWAGQRRSGFFS